MSRLTSFLYKQIDVSLGGKTSGLRGVRIMLTYIVVVSLRQVLTRHEHSWQSYSTCQGTNVVFAVGKYDRWQKCWHGSGIAKQQAFI